MKVELSVEANRELRERAVRAFMLQPGPLHDQYRGPEWSEEEALLAPPQRWLLLPIDNSSFENLPHLPDDVAVTDSIDEFEFVALFPPRSATLRIELTDGAIRVHEIPDTSA